MKEIPRAKKEYLDAIQTDKKVGCRKVVIGVGFSRSRAPHASAGTFYSSIHTVYKQGVRKARKMRRTSGKLDFKRRFQGASFLLNRKDKVGWI